MKRVVHVSNRVNIPRPGEANAGGLDEAISSPPDGYQMVRIGWSGKRPNREEFDPRTDLHDTTVDGVRYITVDLPDKLMSAFYDGDANGFRWAVNHGRTDLAHYSEKNAQVTKKVNEIIAEVVKNNIQPGDVILVHDYHFTEMGECLRKLGVNGPIGHFIHTPTPSAAVLENLEQDQQEYIYNVMDTMYAYDFVGLQAKRDFLNLVPLMSDQSPTKPPEFYDVVPTTKRNGYLHKTTIGVFPVIGMNEVYVEQAKEYEHRQETQEFINSMRVTKPQGIAWERLDYSKGIPNKFDAISLHHARIARGEAGYQGLPTTHFIEVAVYGRDNTDAYRNERAAVTQAYNSLRNVWGRSAANMTQTSVPRPILLGAARQSDYSIVSPMIDGMNLAGIEYIKAQAERDNPGVLILSNTTGLAGVLGNAAILVDPMRVPSIAGGLREALSMSPSERRKHHDDCEKALAFNSNTRWQNELINATLTAANHRLGVPSPQVASAAPAP
jgi:trehalose 6-phosphate synthase